MATESDTIWLLLDSSGIGGIETHVWLLAEALRARGRSVRVVFLADHGPHPLFDRLTESGHRVTKLRGGFRNLLRALREGRPAVLHTHGYKAGILGRLAARIARVPIVSTYHAGEPGRGAVCLYTCLDRRTAWMGEAIAVDATIAARLPRSTAIIPNFVPFDAKAPPSNGRIIAFVGRFSHEKGPDLFCAVAEGLPGGRFEAFGDGPMLADLAVRHAGRVLFHGRVGAMDDHWGRIGLLVMPSRHEGLPLAALEAMARGIPVAAFAVGGLPMLIRDGRNGFLAVPEDVDGLRQAIAGWAAMRPSDRLRMAQAARATVADSYAPGPAVDRICAIYDRL